MEKNDILNEAAKSTYKIEEQNTDNKTLLPNEVGLPPLVIVVQGGRNSGKTTVIRSLVKYYTNQNINQIRGSVTIRNSKNHRITFYECPNNISAMIDLSKIADIALIMLDASIGFEIGTFEFLSLLKNHGFTSVFGVLTHMDKFRQNKSLNKLKKQMKKRFIKEATDKAKLFYLFGLKNELYLKMQMHNLARYLRVIKPSIPLFRQNHPYILADRFDVTFPSNKDDPEEDVMVSFYGYVRGNNFSKFSNVHINGLGDYKIDYMTEHEDPCPIETVEVKGKKKRTLKQKDKVLYAPYCNINTLEFDRNSGYINIPDRFVSFTKGIGEATEVNMNEGIRMVRELQDFENTKNHNHDESFEIMDGVDYQSVEEVDEDEEDEIVKKLDKNNKKKLNIDEQFISKKDKINHKIKSIIEEFDLKSNPHLYRENTTNNLYKLIYEPEGSSLNSKNHKNSAKKTSNFLDMEIDDTQPLEFNLNQPSNGNDIFDCAKYNKKSEYALDFLIKTVKKRFATGSNFEDEEKIKNLNESDDEESDQPIKRRKQNNEMEKFSHNKNSEKNEDGKWTKKDEEEEPVVEKIQDEKKGEINLIKEFCNQEFGIYEKGIYVRIDIKTIKKKFVDNFSIDFPIILCTTNLQENSFGFMKIKFTKHLWHPKILKNNDPIILSIGWRKFQVTPIYCIEEKNHRLRMIKYTPKYTSCFAVCYGPLMPINVACVAIQNYTEKVNHFRICGTGDLIEINQNFEINKKLKLIGEPFEIFKKTAFIKGMFNSNMEVARYIGANLRTVSGIRGQIKKGLNSQPEGSFRATFEDKILKSDIVFLKTWNPITINKFYNPIISYGNMRFLRTMGQLRKDFNLDLPQNPDSEYKEIVREERVFPSLMISKNLELSLPFKAKNKIKSVIKGKSTKYEEDDTFLLKKLNLPHNKPIKSYLTEKEKSIYSMLQRLNTIKNIKDKKSDEVRKEIKEKKQVEHDRIEKLKKKRNRDKIVKSIIKRDKKNKSE